MAALPFQTALLGAVAGFTIFLGLPVARLSVSARTKNLLNGVAVGILLFLLVEILHGALEPVEEATEEVLVAGELGHLLFPFALVVGFGLGLVTLARFEDRYVGRQTDERTLALLIATGIGLHNFSEGLAIGQSAASGAMSLAALLVVGFALHNVTEGFGIAAPLSNSNASLAFVGGLGLLAGGPTFVGTLIGQLWASELASVLFLALAGGALVYVIKELFQVRRSDLSETAFQSTVVVGFLLAFATELVVEVGAAA